MDIHNRLDLTTLADLHNAIDTAPEIQLISQQVMSEQAMMQLITANATADITFGAGVRFDNASNSTSFLFEAAMPLQRSNSQIGNIKAAKAKVLLLSEQQQLLRKSLKHRITITYTQVQEQQQRLSQLQSQLLPLAKTLIEQSGESYRLGKISVLQLLDAQKERFSTERKIIETHSLLLKNRLTLQRLIGNTPLVTLNHESKNTLPLRLKSTTTTLASSLWSKTP
jgi:cobalt-zinc-cadmium efflux system outer membrane protein